MNIVIIDYGSGNLRSASKAFSHAGNGALNATVSAKPEDVRKADRIVLPGQGAFADCMKGLSALPGMLEALHETVIEKARPFLGICVGMQLLAETGLEHGAHKGLGWIAGEVARLKPSSEHLKIPHMGWNTLIKNQPDHPLLKHLPEPLYVYFAHSYALTLTDERVALASTDYGGRFTASVVKNNIAGCQFHPEKSQKTGLQLIRNFLDWKP